MTYDPALIKRIHESGENANTRLGKIVRDADGDSSPGNLFLTSEEYDFVVGRCAEVGVPAPHVDPAADPRD